MLTMRNIQTRLMQYVDNVTPLVTSKMTMDARRNIPINRIERISLPLITSNAISQRIKKIAQDSTSTSINHLGNKKLLMIATAALGITMMTLNTADCAINYQEKIRDYVQSEMCKNILKLILNLSDLSASILVSILEPEMLGDPESEMFQKERQARAAALKKEANKHLSKIESLPKKTDLTMSQMDIIKSICPFDKEPGILFLGRYVSSSKLDEAIRKAQQIERRKK